MRSRINLDMDALRTFVTGFELGSFARAAKQLGRSQSAMSAQLKKLEEQAGVALVGRSGRGLVLTDAGSGLLARAKRILELNDEAVAATQASESESWVRLGVPQDFSRQWLQAVLKAFAESHPRVQVEVHADQSASLIEKLIHGKLDLALAWGDTGTSPRVERLADVATSWVGKPDQHATRQPVLRPIPLITAEAACPIRSAATSALDKAGTAWRIAVATPNLEGIWSAVEAGMGITLRAILSIPDTLTILDPDQAGLPVPPAIPLVLHIADAIPGNAVAHLKEIVMAHVWLETSASARGS